MIGFDGFSQLKTYEILLLFAVYGILGWAVEQLLVVFRGVKGRRGALAVPCGIMYGIGGVLIAGLSLSSGRPWWGALIICVLGAFALNAAACAIIKALSGGRLWKFSLIWSLIGGLIAFAAAKFVHPLLIVLLNHLPLWIEWAFLVVFYIAFISQIIEAAVRLWKKRAGLLSYPRWEAAYPEMSGSGEKAPARAVRPDKFRKAAREPEQAQAEADPQDSEETRAEDRAFEETIPAAAEATVPAERKDVVKIAVPEGDSENIAIPPRVFANGAVLFGSAAGDLPEQPVGAAASEIRGAQTGGEDAPEEKFDLIKELRKLQSAYGFDADEEAAGTDLEVPAAAAATTPDTAEAAAVASVAESEETLPASEPEGPAYRHDKRGRREPKTVVTDPLEHFRRIAEQRKMAPEQAEDYISIIEGYEVPSFLQNDTSTYDFKGPSVFPNYRKAATEDKDEALSIEFSPPDGLS